MTRDAFTLPTSATATDTLALHFCTLFTHEFQKLPGDNCARILKAIEATAQKTKTPADVIALSLVESGLRAPRHCFPESFVEKLEKKRNMPRWNMVSASVHQHQLMDYWQAPVATGYRQASRHLQ